MNGSIYPHKNKQLEVLQQKVEMLRSFVISTIGKDKEGEYNPDFVRRILKASKEKPQYEFKDSTSFLKKSSIAPGRLFAIVKGS